MISLAIKYALNIFYYIGGFITLGVLYFIVYNTNVVIYRTLKAANVSKGPDRQFKSAADIRADMGLIIDWLYKLADYSDVVFKTGITLINNVWFAATAPAPAVPSGAPL